MTRSTKSLITIVSVFASLAATAVPAMADGYSSLSSIVGDESSTSGYSSPTAIVGASSSDESSKPDGYSSPTALLGDGTQAPAPAAETTFASSSPNAILGSDGLGEPTGSPVSSSPSDGFDWGDAAIGSAVGLGLAAMLGVALIVTRRRRPGVQPSV